MVEFFNPPNADPLAVQADTRPYIDSICAFLPENTIKLYQTIVNLFKTESLSEAAISSLIYSSEMFKDQPEVLYLQEDLVIVITINRLTRAELTSKPSKSVSAKSTAVAPTHAKHAVGSREQARLTQEAEAFINKDERAGLSSGTAHVLSVFVIRPAWIGMIER